jgi:uncharacterized membrane protein
MSRALQEVVPLSRRASITVNRPRETVERLWRGPDHRPEYIHSKGAAVRFADAPGDRGTEIHVELRPAWGGKAGEIVRKVTGSEPRAKAMDDLRHFKQLVETGVIARSDGAPEGELAERELRQRPARPLGERAGVS